MNIKTTLAFVLISFMINAQITINSPATMQFVPRGANDVGTFILSGNASAYPGYNQIRSKVLDGTTVLEDFVTNKDGAGNFNVTHHITAALKEYDVEVYVKNGINEILATKICSLVCGDVFVINGQSNAEATFGDEGMDPNTTRPGLQQNALYKNKYCRSIGYDFYIATQSSNPPLPQWDLQFDKPSCIYWEKGYVGGWGLKLQNDLTVLTGIPSCFVNGALGGSSINQHLASNTPSNPNNLNLTMIYDRLFKKLHYNGLTNYVRGIFWYQGETDAATSPAEICDYYRKFDMLYSSWKMDYPNLQQIFMFQINTTSAFSDSKTGLFRDIQEKIASLYPNISIMSTLGTNASQRGPDQDHYSVAGYNNLASKILPIVSKKIYGYNLNNAAILPPKVKKIYMASATDICVEFDKDISVQFSSPPLVPIYSNNTFYGPGLGNDAPQYLNIISYSSSNNILHLYLAQNSAVPTKLSYVPFATAYNTNGINPGHWIYNVSGSIGALGFFEFPVTTNNSNGWDKVYSNEGNGHIGGHYVESNHIFYPGDYDGDGAEEILCVDYNSGANGDWMTVEKYNPGTNTWSWGWSNYGNSSIGIYPYRGILIVGDFTGDGKDDLLGNDPSGWTTLFTYQNGAWNWAWSDYGNSSHPMWIYKNKLYPGDFNGDGKDEILACDTDPGGWTKEFAWNGSDFVATGWSDVGNTSHPIRNYRNDLKPGDYNGDGKTDLLGFGASATAVFLRTTDWVNTWTGTGSIGGWQYPLAQSEKVLIGSIDTDGKNEVLFLNTTAQIAASIDYFQLKTGPPGWNSNWSAVSNIDDWQLALNGSTDTKYYLLKANANEPKYLLSMRDLHCGYLVNMYKTSNTSSNYRSANNGESMEAETELFDSKIETVLIYPNPVSDNLCIKASGQDSVDKIILSDTQGRNLKEVNFAGNEVNISLKDLAAGAYFVKVISNTKTETRKIIKIE